MIEPESADIGRYVIYFIAIAFVVFIVLALLRRWENEKVIKGGVGAMNQEALERLNQAARKFTAAFASFAESFRTAVGALDDLLLRNWPLLAWQIGRSPSERYALAGHPYGKNVRGKKRWTLEMRRKR